MTTMPFVTPRLSIGERDRRWKAVRNAMADHGLDILLCPHNASLWDQLQAYGRYLVPMGAAGMMIDVIFPADPKEDVTAIVPVTAEIWKHQQDWATDIRASMFQFTAGVIARLKELDANGKRIGIPGLNGTPRNPDGSIFAGELRALEAAFPQAEFVDATPWFDLLRERKSAEEVELIRRAVLIAEAGCDVIRQKARPGVPSREVYGDLVGKMIGLGSEPNSMLMWGAGPLLEHSLASIPNDRVLEKGDVILGEIEAKVAGYIGQVTRMAVVGEPDARLNEMFSLVAATLKQMKASMRSGRTFGDLVSICEASAKGTPYQCLPIMHSRGLGDDAPILVFRAGSKALLERPIAEGATLITKVQVRANDGAMAYWGDIMHVTKAGAESLGTQPVELMVCG